MRSLDVGIIGAGTAGSATAIFLARAGHRVTLYEQVPEPSAVGAGITMQPTGLHVLGRLGLREAIVARGAKIDRLVCKTPSGKPIVDLSYDAIEGDFFGLGLHRGVLFEALFDAARREPVTLRTGVVVTGWTRSPSDPARRAIVDANGEAHGAHELVVVADGARSGFRDEGGTGRRVSPYPWGALWAVVADPRDAGDPACHTIEQVARGNATFLGLLPTGHAPGDDDKRLVSVFWSLRASEVDAWRGRGLRAWKTEALALAPHAAPVLDQIEHQEEVLFASYVDVHMTRWATRSIVTLGDAAHATSPQLGQGCNLALWDAMVLADALASEPSDVGRALDRYCRARRDHLAFYQLATRLLTPFFQGDVAALGVLRDAFMPLLGRFDWTNRLMTESMLGLCDGFFGRRVALGKVRSTSRGA